MKKNFIALLLITLIILSSCSSEDKAEELSGFQEAEDTQEIQVEKPELDFSILKIQLNSSLDPSWLNKYKNELEDLLSDELEMPLELVLAPNYLASVEALENKQVHLAFLTPLQYVLASRSGAALPLLKSLRYPRDDKGMKVDTLNPEAFYRGQLLADKESGIASLSDLKGKKVAISSFLSASSYLLPWTLLSQTELDPMADIDWVKVGSHDKAVEAVYDGLCDAAFTFYDARDLFKGVLPEIHDRVRQVLTTPPIASDLLAAIPEVEEELKEKIVEAFIEIFKDERGRELMSKLYDWDGLEAAVDSDYDELRLYLKTQEENSY